MERVCIPREKSRCCSLFALSDILPGRLADILRSDFPKITVADAAQFGTLVSTVHRFALNMIQLCTKPLSAPSPYVRQEAISAAIEKSV